MKKAVVLAVLVVLLSSYFIIAEEIANSNSLSEKAVSFEESDRSVSESECSFFCKIGRFL